MSEVRVTGTLLNPLGAPVPDGIFRFTALRISEQIIPSVEAEYTTDATGHYDFNLKYGTYRMEVFITDEYHIISDITIDTDTPNPIDIVGLSKYSTPVVPPVVIPGDPDWVKLHDDLRTDPHMTRRDIGEQVREGDVYSATLKSLYLSDTADMAEETQSIAKGTTTVEATRNTYSDYANQESVIDKVELKTRKGVSTQSREVYTTSTDIGEYYEVQEYQGDNTYIADNVTFDGSSITAVSTRTQHGNGVTTTEVFSDDAITRTELGKFTATDTDIEFHNDYKVTMVGNVPVLEKNHSTEYTHDLATAIVVDSAGIQLDSGNNLVGEHTKGLTVLGKESYEKFENNGVVAKRTVKADVTSYVGTDDVELVEMDAASNTMTVNGRLIITNPDDFKGPAGDSQYQELQYSIDGTTNWHDVFTLADKWRRHRTVVNGVAGAWSDGYLLQAEDGHPGDTIYIQYNYAPTTTGPWSDVLEEDDIYRIERTVTNGLPGVWSAPARIRGFDGLEGWVTDREYQYAVRATDPAPMWHSNFSAGDHWRRERLVVYVNHEDLENGKPHTIGPWINTTQIVPIKGIDYGAQQTTIYIFKRGATKPDGPTGTLTYNFDNLSLTPAANLNGWSFTDIPDGTDHLWIGMASASTQGSTDDIAPDEWAIQQWTANGQTSALINLFCIYNGAGSPAVTFTSVEQNLSTGAITVTGDNRFGWTSQVPSNLAEDGKLWYITNVKLVIGELALHLGNEFNAPAVLSQNGSNGRPGAPGLNGQGSFTFTGAAGTAKPTSAQIDADVKSIAGRDAKQGDVATYVFGSVTNKDSTQYDFIRGATTWTEFVSVVNGSQIVHGTISAQQIRAATFTGDEFSAAFSMTAGSGNNSATMSGTGSWRLWAGHAVATSAPFRVDQLGNMYATKANISGTVTATSGKFYNVAIGQNSTSNKGIFVSGDAIVVKDEAGRVRVKIGKLS